MKASLGSEKIEKEIFQNSLLKILQMEKLFKYVEASSGRLDSSSIKGYLAWVVLQQCVRIFTEEKNLLKIDTTKGSRCSTYFTLLNCR